MSRRERKQEREDGRKQARQAAKDGRKADRKLARQEKRAHRRGRRRRDLALAWTTIKGRRGGFAAAFIAVLFGSAVICACGILLESAQSSGVPTERYNGAALVVGARQDLPVEGDINPRFAERATLPADRVGAIAGVPGVTAAIPDTSVALTVVTDNGAAGAPDGGPALGHGWGSAPLGPFTTTQGRAPTGPDDVVLDTALADRAGAGVGSDVRLAVGSRVSTFHVTGLAALSGGGLDRQAAAFFTDDRARQLTGHPDRVAAVGVLAAPDTDLDDLADAIRAAVPELVVYADADRAEAEFLDIGQTRSALTELALAFGGSMVVVIMLVVASTLALSVRQRMRELALLRAIGATPKQVLGMIAAETTVVGVAGAVIGVIPGIALASLFQHAFTLFGAIPPDFELSYSPLPLLAAVVLCVIGARLGGWLAARRAARVKPVEALSDAAVEPPELGWLRLAFGWLLIPAGLAAAIVLPLVLPGESAAEGAASSAFLLVFAIALLGPRLLVGAVALLGPRLNRASDVSGFLATANARANSRRLAAATTPLIMGITLAAAQLFSATTADAAAQEQAEAGLRADYTITSSSSGISADVAAELRGVDGVGTVTPVVRSQAIAMFLSDDSPQYRPYAVQGVDPAGIDRTMDLGVLHGDLGQLRDDSTVALSRLAAGTLDAGIGSTVEIHLGDGTQIKPKVVALYEKGLGLGDVTLPHQVVLDHTTNHVDTSLLVSAASGADAAALGDALRAAVSGSPTLRVDDRSAFIAARGEESGDSAIGLVLNGVLLGYLAIIVVNTLVMATVSRFREFALLQLIGATREQVRAMMRGETKVIVAAAVITGSLAALPALVGTALGLTGSLVPSIPPLTYLAIVLAAALLGWSAIMVSTRIAMRPLPVEAIGGRE
ncbi:ABC transporter permease [Actinokineospora terrae]|uniref:Putative ABC transport system permease protein n=1 Tax=Actinokineospora terrae TaxID=155974 RepID=A0A1H9X8Y4_9PSEU|nr:ABC transporter permease [Actinokineospora terrae]SES42595.1 putative ABC transport system permease protein [Actinokineospora terrae]